MRKRVRKKGTVYLAGYTDPTGAQRSAGTFRTRSEAERAAHATERKVEERQWLDRNAGKVLFRDFVEQQWWPSQHHLELTTKAAYRNNLDKHFLPFLGAYPMTSVTPSVVQGWVNQAVQQKLSPRSIRKYHTLLHGIFKAAVRDRVIAFNPCEGTVLPKVVLARRETITPEQFASLLAAIPAQHQVLLRVGIETGMRWGELAALRPRHLDVAAHTLTVAETIVEISKKDSPTGERYTVKPYPKNDQQRILKITPELTALLELRVQSLGLVRDDLLFPSTTRDLRQPTSRNTFRTRVWQPALKTAGLPTTLRMHDLRHAHASWLLAGGADLKTVMDRLGHSQITTTQRYLHALESADDTALEAFQRTRDRKAPALLVPRSELDPSRLIEPPRPEGPSM